MPTLEFPIDLDATIDAAWSFHENVEVALPALSPPDADVRVEQADLPARVGQRVILNVRGPLGKRMRWVANIITFEPPAGNRGERRAVFVDVQESGPFASWKHEHLFTELPDGRTRLVDRVTYRVPLGPLGTLADKLFVGRQIRSMFAHRHAATVAALR